MKHPTPAPNVYSMTGWTRFFGPLVAMIGAWTLNDSLSGRPIYMRGGVLPTPVGIFMSFGLLLGGLVISASAFTVRFRISADSIQIGDVFGKKTLAFDAIRGRREYATGSGRLTTVHFKLEPKDNGSVGLTFQNSFNFDDQFWLWFDQLPDLDSEGSPAGEQAQAR